MLFILDSEMSVCRVTEMNTQDVAKRLMNADLHAARLRVTQSRCPSLVGISGIVLQETKNAFVLVTFDNQLKSKCQHEFSVEVSGRLRLHGALAVISNRSRSITAINVLSKYNSETTPDVDCAIFLRWQAFIFCMMMSVICILHVHCTFIYLYPWFF